MLATPLTRDQIAEMCLAQLPYTPYPVQEDALHSGSVAYYTTPLIALTEQKFQEMQASAVRWGFKADDVGLVTGNRRVNPNARILVVVAEILLNRLLHTEAFDFSNVSAVVMDEFHSFADLQRGIVWELSLSMLPSHVR